LSIRAPRRISNGLNSLQVRYSDRVPIVELYGGEDRGVSACRKNRLSTTVQTAGKNSLVQADGEVSSMRPRQYRPPSLQPTRFGLGLGIRTTPKGQISQAARSERSEKTDQRLGSPAETGLFWTPLRNEVSVNGANVEEPTKTLLEDIDLVDALE